MLTSDIMNLINEVEENFPVEMWKIDNIHIWPLIRIKINFDLFDTYHASKPEKVSRFGRRAIAICSSFLQYVIAYISDHHKNAQPNSPADVIFLSDGVSFASVKGKWHERCCDPLIRLLYVQNFSTFMMTPESMYLRPRFTPSMFIQPFLDLIRIKKILLKESRTHNAESLPEFEKFLEFLNSSQVPLKLSEILPQIRLQCSVVKGFADFYVKIFRKTKPRIGFCVSYYSVTGMAFNLACREYNIPSFDIQHGLQGDLHVAYGRWNKLPAAGYELLPKYFWCWDEAEVESITKWSSKISQWHKPIMGGNLWLEGWQKEKYDFISWYDRKIKTQKESLPAAARHILVTLQFNLTDSDTLGPLLAAIKISPSEWHWWIRLHPCSSQEEKNFIHQFLLHENKDKYEINMASEFPLYALLRHMDVHVTHSSSTVIEALTFKVPSVIMSTYGNEFFHAQVESGWAIPAFSAEQILKAVLKQIESRKKLIQTKLPAANTHYESSKLLLHFLTK
ncbi:MAG: hypothetical protein AMJ61_04480 [Desulfobacterales bacterium SG8_35_2]|nr:MAG: hypothetical protein AMJ61_04480 [Desulfobacterales bacterium SG8_35_2]